MPQVGLGQAAIELAETNDRLIRVFVAGSTDGIQNANGCQEGASGGGR